MRLARALIALGFLLACSGLWIVAGWGWAVLATGVGVGGFGLVLVDVGEIDHRERAPD